MKERVREICVVFLALVISIGFSPMIGANAFAEDGVQKISSEKPVIEEGLIHLDKTATELDSKLETQVNLSFPGEEVNWGSDIVFVLDKSGYSAYEETIDKAISALKNLRTQSQERGTPIKVGVVLFNRFGNIKAELTDIATDEGYQTVENAIKRIVSRGTNMHAGLLAGRQLLDNDTTVKPSRKHLILISDGATYLFSKNNDYTTCYTKAYGNPKEQIDPNTGQPYKNGYSMEGGIWEYLSRDYNVNYTNEEIASGIMPQYTAMLNVENLGKYLQKKKESLDAYEKYDYPYEYGFFGFGPAKPVPKDKVTPISRESVANIDASFIYSDEVFQDMVAKGYNTYVYFKNTGDYDGKVFLEYLTRNTGGLKEDFVDLQNNCVNIISPGSKVVDFVEKDFDFVNKLDKIKIKHGGENLPGEKIDSNKYGFGKKDDGTYSFVLSYDKENKKLTLDINVDVTPKKVVNLTYNEKLVKEPKEAGKYKLDTNEKAELYCKDSKEKEYQPLVFPKPKVNYEAVSVTYDPNGGNFDGNKEPVKLVYRINTDIKLMKAPKRKGYKFLYWEQPQMKPGDQYKLTENHVFVAKWKKIEYKKVKALKTGDSNRMGIYGTLGLAAAGTLILLIRRKQIKNK